MRFLSVLSAAVLTLSASAVSAEPSLAPRPAIVEGTAADGARFYEDSLVIHAPAHALWVAFTDGAAYRRWSVPVVAIDFRLGGVIEASYDPHGHIGDPQNIKNAFIAYIPERLLVFRNVQAPDQLPGRDAYARTVKIVEFQALGPMETKVTVSGVGFGKGADFDQLYAFFSQGDAEMLSTLKRAMETQAVK